MIAQLRGTLIQKTPVEVIIDCGGVGYSVSVSTITSEKLPETGASITLLTMLIIREDAHQLFGFLSEAERDIFKLLISISGIGPKTAITILSAGNLADLQDTIMRGDLSRLQKLPGVGKKTAERIIVELRDKIGKVEGFEESADEAIASATQRDVRDETLAAMVKLGYQRAAADKAIKAALQAEPTAQFTVEQLLRKALRNVLR
ncbi:MAG: Holliday junction branch migration protein RuvA [Candidatus Kapabacteria bacterium]|jgi:Holliday junction DNA helicase RuvA|nr:Holliday junction branch migration protein RuvA [Candidatus Kapabacteria bacterium]